MQFEGTQITAANYSSIFEVTNAGAVGSTIRLTPVPEPASVLAVGALGLGIAAAVRRGRAGR